MRSICVLCLFCASLTLSGCETLTSLLTRQIPPLDTSLAADCPTLTKPQKPDYDVWQFWVEQVVLPAYHDCASRHHQTVKSWPK